MYASYDTESSNLQKYGLLYEWGKSYTPTPHDEGWYSSHVCESTDEIAYISGRNYDELLEDLMFTLYESLDGDVMWRVSFHNLPHDFSFIRPIVSLIDTHLKTLGEVDRAGESRQIYSWDSFCRNSTSLTSLTVVKNVPTREGWREVPVWALFDTLALSGLSVRAMGGSVAHKLETDYSLIRTPATVLDDDEEAYQRADTDTVFAWVMNTLLKKPGVTISRLGFRAKTKTGLVRLGDKTRFLKDKRLRLAEDAYQETYNDTTFNYKLVNFSKGGYYAGGVNFSNYNENGAIHAGVASYDFKSSYPAVMWQCDVPVDPKFVDSLPTEFLEVGALEPNELSRVPFWVSDLVFENVRIKPSWWDGCGSTSITKSMIYGHASDRLLWKNACLWSCDRLVMSCTMTTFAEMRLQYEWDSVSPDGPAVVWCEYAQPSLYLLSRVHFHYGEKAYAKDVAKGRARIDYDEALRIGYIGRTERDMLIQGVSRDWLSDFAMRHKADLNSLYGIMVTDESKERYKLSEDAEIVPDEEEFDGSSKLIRVHGVYIAEMARYRLVWCTARIVEAGGLVLHGDTDSCKCIGVTEDQVMEACKDYTESCRALTASRLKELGDLWRDIHGEELPDVDMRGLGEFEHECDYDKFVTFGKKKYAVLIDGEYHATCSGYRLATLKEFYEFARKSKGEDWALIASMGYGNLYGASTKIANEYYTVKDMFTTCRALDYNGDLWEGTISPGRGIRDREKVMNDPEQMLDTCQRWLGAESRQLVDECSHLHIMRREDGEGFEVYDRMWMEKVL